MFTLLAVFGSLLGIFILLAACLTLWHIYQNWRLIQQDKHRSSPSMTLIAGRLLMKWSVFDYAVLLMFVIGTVFLLVNLLAVIRDRQLYPFYYYGYLLFGVMFSVLGMLFMFVRLALVLKLLRSDLSSMHHEQQPNHADESK